MIMRESILLCLDFIWWEIFFRSFPYFRFQFTWLNCFVYFHFDYNPPVKFVFFSIIFIIPSIRWRWMNGWPRILIGKGAFECFGLFSFLFTPESFFSFSFHGFKVKVKLRVQRIPWFFKFCNWVTRWLLWCCKQNTLFAFTSSSFDK